MVASQLMLPANRAFNSNGFSEPGAVAKLYDTGTSTPATFYADESLTIPLGTSITANAAGRFATPAYQNADTPFRLVIEDADGNELDDIDPYYFGTVYGSTIPPVASRAALAAINGAANQMRYLTESGREGEFVWNSANLTAEVTADTAQGIYVAPASDTTGASGAWVRKYTGPVDIRWFGGKADGAISATSGAYLGTLGATDNSVALNAAIAFLSANSMTSGSDGTNRAGAHIVFPAANGVYDFQSTVQVRRSIRISGSGTQSAGGVSNTILRWRPGMHGLIFHYYASDTSGVITPANYGAGGSIVENVQLYQHATGNVITDEYHGIWAKCPVHIEHFGCSGWSGSGIHIVAAIGAGGPSEGNANNFYVGHGMCYQNEHGIFIDGADANAGIVEHVDATNNRGYGIYDTSFLGNLIVACHTDSNGLANSAGNTTGSVTSFGGNWYAVIPGQTAGASTNAPTGTGADNTWWAYLTTGGASAQAPEWVTGMTWREGGAYRADEASGRTTFLACYSEGSQGASYIVSPATVIGGLHGARVLGTGRQFTGGVWNDLSVDGDIVVRGDTHDFGPTTGAIDNVMNVRNSNVSNTVNLVSYSAGSPQTDATIVSNRTAGSLELKGRTKAILGFTGTDVLVADTNGISVTGPIATTNASTTRTNLGLGTAAVKNTGTSGNNVALLDGVNTWSGRQVFSAEISAAGFRDNGSLVARFEGTGIGVPTGSTGVGFELYTASGTGNLQVYNRTTPGHAPLKLNASTITFQLSDATQASVVSGGIDAATLYKVGGTQVVGAQGAAVADATDAATAISQLNLLLARCRAHGLIAT